MNFQFKRLKWLDQVEGQLSRANTTDAGADIRANQEYIIRAKDSEAVGTGISINIPPGYMGMVRPRSGMGFKYDVVCMGGVIDSYYTGEVRVKIFNLGYSPYKIAAGDRIAQVVMVPIAVGEFIEVEELDTEREIREYNDEVVLRGSSGFGSSGLQ